MGVALSSHRVTSIVEIVGPAGSGKSTLAAALANRPAVRTVSSISRAEPRARQLLAALRAMPAVMHLVGPRTTRRQIAWIGRLVALDALVRRTRDDVLVLDQGPLYTLSRVLAARPDLADDRWLTGRIERWAERLDAVVVLDAPDDDLVARIRSRGKDHVVKAVPDDIALASVRAQRAELDAVVAAASVVGLRVVCLRTDHASADQLAVELMTTVLADIAATADHAMKPS
jgi:nicotinamide riboside kinase